MAEELLTPDEQLRRWQAGESVCPNTRGECCPDFSCCNPELLASQEQRDAFVAAGDEERHAMLLGFLGGFTADKNVYVAGAPNDGSPGCPDEPHWGRTSMSKGEETLRKLMREAVYRWREVAATMDDLHDGSDRYRHAQAATFRLCSWVVSEALVGHDVSAGLATYSRHVIGSAARTEVADGTKAVDGSDVCYTCECHAARIEELETEVEQRERQRRDAQTALHRFANEVERDGEGESLVGVLRSIALILASEALGEGLDA